MRSFPDCERGEYEPLESISDELRAQWYNSLRLDLEHEGRAEFFEALWVRIGDLLRNPHLFADSIVRNMQLFGAEGVRYIEGQAPFHGMITADGASVSPTDVLEIYKARLEEDDAKNTGVTLRLQMAVLRFMPHAETSIRMAYEMVAQHPELVSVNLVGREDNDKGYPARFLDVFRDMRRTHSGVNLAIHAGEVDEPNEHVRDTLLLGAKRIGHGVNLITDPDTLLLMRYNQFLVEVNLVSNLLLEYVEDLLDPPLSRIPAYGYPGRAVY